VAIAKKLEAEIQRKTKHDKVLFKHEGKLVAYYNLRRDKTAGHAYVPGQLYISETLAMRLASCTLSKAEYVKLLEQNGHIDPPPPEVKC
jgi:hypothetical protein